MKKWLSKTGPRVCIYSASVMGSNYTTTMHGILLLAARIYRVKLNPVIDHYSPVMYFKALLDGTSPARAHHMPLLYSDRPTDQRRARLGLCTENQNHSDSSSFSSVSTRNS